MFQRFEKVVSVFDYQTIGTPITEPEARVETNLRLQVKGPNRPTWLSRLGASVKHKGAQAARRHSRLGEWEETREFPLERVLGRVQTNLIGNKITGHPFVCGDSNGFEERQRPIEKNSPEAFCLRLPAWLFSTQWSVFPFFKKPHRTGGVFWWKSVVWHFTQILLGWNQFFCSFSSY